MIKKLLERSIEIATSSVSNGGGPFGAVISWKGHVISEGSNQVTATCDPTAHAEIVAIRLAARKLNTFNLKNCIIYCSSEPCAMCLAAIYWSHITKVYYVNSCDITSKYGFDDNYIYSQLRSKAGRKVKLYCQNVSNALEPFHSWKRKTNKVLY